MRQNDARKIALGGVLAALAVVIMCLGGIIPVATYVCPMLCCVTGFVVLCFCGRRIGWAWFAAVAFLAVLLGPDKEATLVFLALGYYPLIKHVFDRSKIPVLLKLLYFNASITVVYAFMIHLLGMQEIVTENMEFGLVGLAFIMVLGNLTFFLLDRLLNIMSGKLR